MKPSVCLVTGGTGVLGCGIKSYLQTLSTEGDERYNNVEFVYLSSKDGDCRRMEDMQKVFERYQPTYVIHLAAKVGGLYANMNDNIGFFTDNTEINLCIIKLCHMYKIQQAIFCLSTCVFPTAIKLPLSEDVMNDGPPHFSNEGYSVAKRNLEMLVRLYRQSYGYDWLCVIPTNLYGPHDNFNVDAGHVLPGLIHKCYLAKQDNHTFTIFGSGKPRRQFLYTLDCGQLIIELLMMDSSKQKYSSYILCDNSDGGEVSISEAANMIMSAMKFKGNVEYDTTRGDGAFQKTASNARLLELIGKDFKFTSLQEGIQKTVDWFVENYESCRK